MSNQLFMDVIKRDDVSFELTFTDVDGAAINLTGATVFFTVKKKKTDVDAAAVIAKTLTNIPDPTEGKVTLQLTNTDTNIPPRAYYFDVQLKDASNKISSIKAGSFIVTQDVTIRTS